MACAIRNPKINLQKRIYTTSFADANAPMGNLYQQAENNYKAGFQKTLKNTRINAPKKRDTADLGPQFSQTIQVVNQQFSYTTFKQQAAGTFAPNSAFGRFSDGINSTYGVKPTDYKVQKAPYDNQDNIILTFNNKKERDNFLSHIPHPKYYNSVGNTQASLGSQRVREIAQQVGTPTYGKQRQTPMFKALIYDYKKQNNNNNNPHQQNNQNQYPQSQPNYNPQPQYNQPSQYTQPYYQSLNTNQNKNYNNTNNNNNNYNKNNYSNSNNSYGNNNYGNNNSNHSKGVNQLGDRDNQGFQLCEEKYQENGRDYTKYYLEDTNGQHRTEVIYDDEFSNVVYNIRFIDPNGNITYAQDNDWAQNNTSSVMEINAAIRGYQQSLAYSSSSNSNNNNSVNNSPSIYPQTNTSKQTTNPNRLFKNNYQSTVRKNTLIKINESIASHIFSASYSILTLSDNNHQCTLTTGKTGKILFIESPQYKGYKFGLRENGEITASLNGKRLLDNDLNQAKSDLMKIIKDNRLEIYAEQCNRDVKTFSHSNI